MTAFSQTEWLHELSHAAEDLGYVIERFDWSGSVTLMPKKDQTGRTRITFEGIFTSGAYLRSVLQPLKEVIAP